MDDIAQLQRIARGNWPRIYSQLGINMPKQGKHGPCPLCGTGIDRLHFDDKDSRGTWHCRQCEGKRAGDGLSMVSRYFNVSLRAAMKMVADVL